MQKRKLSTLDVPSVGMGTWQTFDVRSETEIAMRQKIITACLEEGVTFLDSSPMYGESESVLGRTIADKSGSFQLATKVWCQGRATGKRQITQSFQRLWTDYVDVFQIHNLLDWKTHLPVLEQLKAEGKIGLIGITHYATTFYPEMIQMMKSGRFDTVQVPYNVLERTCEAEILPLAEELGIGVIVMQPLGVGKLVTGLKSRPDLSPLQSHGIETWAQALLAWILADPRVSVIIPATSKPERIRENAAVGSLPALPDELRVYIESETRRCL
ncbi:MAG: aldo/keto reductase [Candidatus Poribacteria bacterium]|nr:aldo/keto reductase [Candidatus Poribacteria bacterium]